MDEIEPLTRERIDDVPVLLVPLERMQGATLLDRHFPSHAWQLVRAGKVALSDISSDILYEKSAACTKLGLF